MSLVVQTTVSYAYLCRSRASPWLVPELFERKCSLALSYWKYRFVRLIANARKTKIKYRKNLATFTIIRMKAWSSGPVIELTLASKNDRFLTIATRIATARMQYEARMTLYPRLSVWLSHVIEGGCSLRIDRPTHKMTRWRTSNATKARATKFQ